MADTLDLITLAEGKTAVGEDTAANETALAAAITAVSRRIDEGCGPVVARTVTGELHDGGRTTISLRFWPLLSVSSVTEYDRSGASQALTAETVSTKPAEGYLLTQYTGTPATAYGPEIHRRSTGWDHPFEAGESNVSVTYSAGRYANTAAVDALFKEAAKVTLKNWWRQSEISVNLSGEFDVPGQTFPRFAVPNAAAQLLDGEWRSSVGFA